MRNNLYILIISFILQSCGSKQHTPIVINLHKSWEFKQGDSLKWYAASVPGEVHSDLLNNNLIDDPFIGSNEHDLQWITETNWEYKTQFLLEQNILNRKHIDLNFEGLDTYAKVYLNDSLIINSNNAFNYWTKDVKSLLKAKNTLKVEFTSPTKIEELEKAKLGYKLPEGNRIFTRKAQFQYGWDWGPKLNTMGVWRPITLTAFNDYKIENIFIDQRELNDSIANLTIKIDEENQVNEILNYEVYVNNELHFPRPEKPEIPITIKNPKRWWPHNLGEPYLYDIKVVVKKGNIVLDSISKKIGLRTTELVNKKDSIGESLYFKVNDVPVYAKGANYIPQHSFQNQVTDKHYEKLLSDVVVANMNMLRVWGGGIYENDIFYDLCDKKGILVWQDFMFACAMYPGDQTFLKNVQQEATYNVKRLRNHPSIALWCGNNENSEGWHRWGWQTNRSDDEKKEIWNNYLKVFDSILPKTVNQSTNVDYWESSPKYGRGNPNYEFVGDAHDWWIWHDAYPFEHLEEHVPRFMSEFGMQAFPSYETITYINNNESIDISTKDFKNHQKHERGFQLIDEYINRDFPVPTNAEDYVYMSQVMQAYGITKGIEAHRRARPKNMGTLYWQLNDCWPAISWSSIDYFGNWKALHYKAKKSFENLLISSVVKDNSLEIIAINDNLVDIELNLDLELLDFNGNKLWSQNVFTIANANSSQSIFKTYLDSISFDKQNCVLKVYSDDKQWLKYFSKPKELKLKEGSIETNFYKTTDGFKIVLSSSTLQKDVFLFTDVKGFFNDNFFDLLPNEVKTIRFITDSKTLGDLKIKSLNQFVN